MSLLTDAPPQTAAVAGTPDPATPRRRRQILVRALVAAAVVAIAVLTTLATSGRPVHTGSLDPDNTYPEGSAAIATALRQHGVQVEVVRSERDYLAATMGAGTSVVLSNTAALSERTAATARRHAVSADRLVAVMPSIPVLQGLAVGAEVRGAVLAGVPASCPPGDAHPGERISGGYLSYLAARRSGAVTCFAGPDRGGVYLRFPAGPGRPETVVLAGSELLANASILRYDNAALAVRTLGHSRRLVWYVANVRDVDPGQTPSIQAQLPSWLRPSLWLLAIAFVVLALWRGRRLGRLAVEPLPVVVRALETTRSRGRMYRKARDIGRTAQVLREGTRRRLARYLGLGAGATPTQTSRAVATAVDRPVPEVERLLSGSAPASESQLFDLARDLITLEDEVRGR